MALVFTAAQARASDEFAINTLGLPGLLLMENAGRGVVRVLRRVLQNRGKSVLGCPVAVVCGAGQNAGDGFVIARHLHVMGAQVQVYLALPAHKLAGDAQINFQALQALGGVSLQDLSAVNDAHVWQSHLRDHHVIVDAVFGTGLRADVSGVPALAIAACNASSALRVAVDVPSGIDANTGHVRGVAFEADVTATMAAYKLGLLLHADAPVGDVHVVSLGVPVHAPAQGGPYAHWIDEALCKPLLPQHAQAAHKGSRGHLLLLAGSQGKTGAAALSARAAMRAGAGMATVATTGPAQTALDTKLWEVMSAAYSAADDAEPSSEAAVQTLAQRCKAVALGPGIPTGPQMQTLVRRLCVHMALPMVVDADGLNHLGGQVVALKNAAGPRVLTPHPAEMGRLLGLSTEQVQADRLQAVRKLAALSGAVAVLKGARTLVAQPDGTVFINPAATSALATAGSGDVLTGVIGALLAQGLNATDAAVCGVFVHGQAAQEACTRLELAHLVASDLPDAVARCLHRLR